MFISSRSPSVILNLIQDPENPLIVIPDHDRGSRQKNKKNLSCSPDTLCCNYLGPRCCVNQIIAQNFSKQITKEFSKESSLKNQFTPNSDKENVMSKPKILALDEVRVKHLLEQDFDVTEVSSLQQNQLIKIIPDFDGFISRSGNKFDREFFDAATNVKIGCRSGAGFDGYDLAHARSLGIPIG